jgi:hypothetical protein
VLASNEYNATAIDSQKTIARRCFALTRRQLSVIHCRAHTHRQYHSRLQQACRPAFEKALRALRILEFFVPDRSPNRISGSFVCSTAFRTVLHSAPD